MSMLCTICHVVVIGRCRSYHHQPYTESAVPISSQVLLYGIGQDVSWKDRLCSSCPFDSRINVSLVSTVVLISIASRCVWVDLVLCIAECILPSLNPFRDELTLCSGVPGGVRWVSAILRRKHWLRGTLLHKNWDWLQSASDFGCTLLRSVHCNDIRQLSGVLPNRRPNLSHYDQRVPANLFEPFRAVQDEDKCVACFWDIASTVSLRACSLSWGWGLLCG